MSINIDCFRVDELKDLSLPLEAIRNMPYVDIHMGKDGALKIDGTCEVFLIEGKQDASDLETVLVDKLAWGGEGSGQSWDDFREMMNHSRGTLKALVIWQGCEVQRYSSVDGYQRTESF